MLLLTTYAFGLTLDEAWTATLENNHDLKLMHEQVIQAEALRFQALAAIQPQLTLTSNYIINDHATTVDLASSFMESIPEEFASFFEGTETEPMVIEEKAYGTWEFQAAQPLFSGQALPGLRMVGQNVKAAKAEEIAVVTQVRAGLAKAYWGVIVARQGVELAELAIKNARKHMEMVEVQLTTGVAPPTAKLQAELAVSRTEREVATAHANLTAAEQALRLLTGIEDDISVSEPTPQVLPFGSPEEVLQSAILKRSDIEAAEYRVAAAQSYRTLSYAEWMPVVYGVFKVSHSPETAFNPEPTRWRFIINAKWEFWDGGMRIGENQTAASQYRQATEAELKLHSELELQVHTAWQQYTRSDAALKAVEREVGLATENLRLAEVAFEAGSLTFLDLEDARLGWQAAQVSRLAERMSRELAVIDLLVAGGIY